MDYYRNNKVFKNFLLCTNSRQEFDPQRVNTVEYFCMQPSNWPVYKFLFKTHHQNSRVIDYIYPKNLPKLLEQCLTCQSNTSIYFEQHNIPILNEETQTDDFQIQRNSTCAQLCCPNALKNIV